MFRQLLFLIILKVFITQLDACVSLFINTSMNNTISKTIECNASKIYFEYSEGENVLLECSKNVSSSNTYLEFDGTKEWRENSIIKNITFSELQNNTILECGLRKLPNDSFVNQQIDLGQIQLIFRMKVENSSNMLNNFMTNSTEPSTLDLMSPLPIVFNRSSSNLTISKDSISNLTISNYDIDRFSTMVNAVHNISHTSFTEISTEPGPSNISIDSKTTTNLSASPSTILEKPMFTILKRLSNKSMTRVSKSTDLSSELATTPYETTTLFRVFTKPEQDQSSINFMTLSNLVVPTQPMSTSTNQTSLLATKSNSSTVTSMYIPDMILNTFVNTNLNTSISPTTIATLEKEPHPLLTKHTNNKIPTIPTSNLTLPPISSNTAVDRQSFITSPTLLSLREAFMSLFIPTFSNSISPTISVDTTLNTNQVNTSSNTTSSMTLYPFSTMTTEEFTTETTLTLDKPLQPIMPSIPNGTVFSIIKSTKTLERQPATFPSTSLDTMQFTLSDNLTAAPVSTTESHMTILTSSVFNTNVTEYSVTTTTEDISNSSSFSTINITMITEYPPSAISPTFSTTEEPVSSNTITSFLIPTLPMIPEKNKSTKIDLIPLLNMSDITNHITTTSNITSNSTTPPIDTTPPVALSNATLMNQPIDNQHRNTLSLSTQLPFNILNVSSTITTVSTTTSATTLTDFRSTTTYITPVSVTSNISSPILSTIASTTDLLMPLTSNETVIQTLSTSITSVTSPMVTTNLNYSTTSSNITIATTLSQYFTTPPEETSNFIDITMPTKEQPTTSPAFFSTETSAPSSTSNFSTLVPTSPMISEENQTPNTVVTPILSTNDITNHLTTSTNVISTSATSSVSTRTPKVLSNVTSATRPFDKQQNKTLISSTKSPLKILDSPSTITTSPTTTLASTFTNFTSTRTDIYLLSNTSITTSPILSTTSSTTNLHNSSTSRTTDNIQLVTPRTENITKLEDVADKRKNHLPDLMTLLVVLVLMFIVLTCSFIAIYRMIKQYTHKSVSNNNLSNDVDPEMPPYTDESPNDYVLFENRSDNTSSSTTSIKEFQEELYSKPLPKAHRHKHKNESMCTNRNISNRSRTNDTHEEIQMDTMYGNTSANNQIQNNSDWIYSNQEICKNEPAKEVYAQIKPKRNRKQPTYANIPIYTTFVGSEAAQPPYSDPLDNE